MNPLEENDSHSHLFRLPALNPLRSSLDWTLFMSLFEFPGLMVMFSPFTLSDCWDSNAKPNPEKSVGFQQSKKKKLGYATESARQGMSQADARKWMRLDATADLKRVQNDCAVHGQKVDLNEKSSDSMHQLLHFCHWKCVTNQVPFQK